MLAESQTRKQEGHKPFFRTKTDPEAAFPASILHHQINSFDEFTNADTLAPIVKKQRSETQERGELFVFIRQIQK